MIRDARNASVWLVYFIGIILGLMLILVCVESWTAYAEARQQECTSLGGVLRYGQCLQEAKSGT